MTWLTYGPIRAAFGQEVTPFDYQARLAGGNDGAELESKLIQIPTGCGKTAAVVMAWLWNRVWQPNADARAQWPCRLVFCLPMRTLVEQTRDKVRIWLSNLGDREWKGEGKHDGKVGLHILVGGEEKTDWDLFRVAFPRCRHPRFDPCKNDSWRE